MHWDVMLLFAGLIFVAAWAYGAVTAHNAKAGEEESMDMVFVPSNQHDLMESVRVPEVFDERRMASDLARLASSPTAIGQYIAQAEIRFTHKQQQ
ncbi:MAG: hypothetical protein ACR2H4_19630 [Pyrinomonadaceae bacterium]